MRIFLLFHIKFLANFAKKLSKIAIKFKFANVLIDYIALNVNNFCGNLILKSYIVFNKNHSRFILL